MSKTRRWFLCFTLLVMLPVLAVGSSLPAPSGSVLLKVTGAIGTHNADEAAVFDRAMLEQLEWVEIETHTSFTTGPQTFSGPTLSSVLAAVGASGKVIRATAVNDYAVDIPVADADLHKVVLAMDMNGKPMRVRDRGPIWVVYPLSEEEAEKQPFDEQMIWQLVQMRIE